MSDEPKGKPTNMREMRRQGERKFLWMVVLTLVVLGLVLIGLVYGWTAVLTAAPCLLGGAGTLWFLFYLLEKLQKRLEER
ncbi:MAG: hypothetical protein IPL28_19800 [Chloroflexi bacterium]|nr:hypothetical protein [Chloroflexota bacterium]MDA0245807.1 hypothetical protein [Chloroflexota bacterium]